jgi:tetratricopeptide (TPR) repeat protein
MSSVRFLLVVLTALLGWPCIPFAAPHTPFADSVVVEQLPLRAQDPASRELNRLRSKWRQDPQNPALAAELARAYFEQAVSEGDPRYLGYAQAALKPWWSATEPPPVVRLVRGMVLQFSHRFPEAIKDLTEVSRLEPNNAVAWSWLAAIYLVTADYAKAREACNRLTPLAAELAVVGCQTYVDSLTGRAKVGLERLSTSLRQQPRADPALRLWALTRMAEISERLGEYRLAEQHFRAALALDVRDTYLLAAYSDYLLDQGRPAEVLTLLKDFARADTLLLRLALAARDTGSPDAAKYQQEMRERFDAARRQGDALHEKEESRFARSLLKENQRALALAESNYRIQREAADARALLEASIACRSPQSAEPVLQWMAQNRVESTVLQSLAQQVRAIKATESAKACS